MRHLDLSGCSDIYVPKGHRGRGGTFSAYSGDNAEMFTLKPPSASVVQAVQAPLYAHEIHLIRPGLALDIPQLEKKVFKEVSSIVESVDPELGLVGSQSVWSVHLVDLYTCPRTKQLSHALEIAYCNLNYPLCRMTADKIRELVEKELPGRLSRYENKETENMNEFSLRTEKAGGRVSKPHSWLIATALAKNMNNNATSRAEVGSQYEANVLLLSDALRKMEPQRHINVNATNATNVTLDKEEDAKEEEKHEANLHRIKALARSLWKRRIGVLINQMCEDEELEDREREREIEDVVSLEITAKAKENDTDTDTDTGTDVVEDKDYCVYLLTNTCNKRTYLGITNNSERRLRQHNGNLAGGARYTRAFKGTGDWKYRLQVKGVTKRQALSIERTAKNKNTYSSKDPVERRMNSLLPVLEKYEDLEIVEFNNVEKQLNNEI